MNKSRIYYVRIVNFSTRHIRVLNLGVEVYKATKTPPTRELVNGVTRSNSNNPFYTRIHRFCHVNTLLFIFRRVLLCEFLKKYRKKGPLSANCGKVRALSAECRPCNRNQVSPPVKILRETKLYQRGIRLELSNQFFRRDVCRLEQLRRTGGEDVVDEIIRVVSYDWGHSFLRKDCIDFAIEAGRIAVAFNPFQPVQVIILLRQTTIPGRSQMRSSTVFPGNACTRWNFCSPMVKSQKVGKSMRNRRVLFRRWASMR